MKIITVKRIILVAWILFVAIVDYLIHGLLKETLSGGPESKIVIMIICGALGIGCFLSYVCGHISGYESPAERAERKGG